MGDPLWTPSVDDVVAIHDDIVSEYPNTSGGVRDRGAVSYAVERIEHGHPSGRSEDIHEQASLLLRLIVANHPFVDANKRTALGTVAAFYVLNGYRLEYDDGIRTILKDIATNEADIDRTEVREYFRERARRIDTESVLREHQADLVEFGLDRYRESEE